MPPDPRAGLSWIFHVSLLCMLYGGIGVAAIAAVSRDLNAFVGACSIALVTPGLLFLLRRGSTRLAMTLAVSLILVVAGVEVVIGDGVHDVGVGLFTVVVLVSALLLDRRASLAFSVLSVLTVCAIGVAELTGWLRTPLSHEVVPGELAILVFLLATFAVLIHAVTRALHGGLEQAALNERTYREIFNATTEGIFVHDVETGRVVDVNDTACAMSGFTREEFIGLSIEDIERVGGKPLRGSFGELFRRACHEGPQSFEWQAVNKDGSGVWLDVVMRAADIRGERRVLVTVRDIGERKAAAEQLRAAERLQALGQLAGGVAHDFNNQLAGITANAALLEQRIAGDAQARACIDAIRHCCQRSADLTRQLLAFARKGDRREDVVDVDALVREVAELLERSIDKRVALQLDLAGGGSARVVGDASFLQSALLNLGLNARDAMPNGGLLRFETRCLRASELPERVRAELPEPGCAHVRVRVSDTGKGIAHDDLGRIFEPFYTSKAQGHGMGLSAAYGTVQAHRGTILVTSAVGVGSTFELFLPATDLPLAQPRKPEASRPPPRLRVLLAEDERVVGRATELLLQELGCAVTWCRDGREALDAFERAPDAFDLLMIDHAMPRMLGSEVAERVAALRPGLPIIATSGFAEGLGEGAARPHRIFLPKPFDLEQLTAALGDALHRSHAAR